METWALKYTYPVNFALLSISTFQLKRSVTNKYPNQAFGTYFCLNINRDGNRYSYSVHHKSSENNRIQFRVKMFPVDYFLEQQTNL